MTKLFNIRVILFNLQKLIKMDVIGMVETIGKTHTEPIRNKKAVLWGQVDVLAQAIGQFLEASMIWDVTRIPTEAGAEILVRETRRVNPDIVILCQERVDDDASLPIRLIQGQPCCRVVTVELESNQIQVYSKQNVIVQGASDLLSIIESGIFPDCTHAKEVGSTKNP